MEQEGFTNVKNQIGYCGIWCGGCIGGNGVVQELARKFEQIVVQSKEGLEMYGPKEFNFDVFMKGLTWIQEMKLCPGCKKGGGNSTCAIRICSSKRNMENCSKCKELISCRNFEELQKYNPKIREDLAKIKNVSQDDAITKWTDGLKTKWPHCVLLCKANKQC